DRQRAVTLLRRRRVQEWRLAAREMRISHARAKAQQRPCVVKPLQRRREDSRGDAESRRNGLHAWTNSSARFARQDFMKWQRRRNHSAPPRLRVRTFFGIRNASV